MNLDTQLPASTPSPNELGATNRPRETKLLLLEMSISEPENAKAIAARIKQSRNKMGLSRDALADLLRVHRKTVANWESQSNPTFPQQKLAQLAGVLNVEIPWLLHGDGVVADPDLKELIGLLAKKSEAQDETLKNLDETLKLLLKKLDGDSPG